ncbi:hypothetical protein MKK68_02325 [Methylobacterium sp. E-016]|uniref:hypothetical protein n=1 Tax=Methylobacterium sp. E-016 TaxID=2836556 RepID=UPI001FBA11F2|nr:hypothetical protein [Methylobacterium sp. E-016]MCJ2074496.1 hypothetical protein [Methylobacterium sp. E-016]
MAHVVHCLRAGRADTETIEHGTIIEFARDTPDIGARDMLMITAPSGGSLNLKPVGKRAEGGTYVLLTVRPAWTFRGWLEHVDGGRWRFQLEARHLAILDRLKGAA